MTCSHDDILHAYMDEHPDADKNEIEEILLWLIYCSKGNRRTGWEKEESRHGRGLSSNTS